MNGLGFSCLYFLRILKALSFFRRNVSAIQSLLINSLVGDSHEPLIFAFAYFYFSAGDSDHVSTRRAVSLSRNANLISNILLLYYIWMVKCFFVQKF